MEQLSTTAWMQEVESHTRAQGDKADDCMDAGGRITHGAVIDDYRDVGDQAANNYAFKSAPQSKCIYLT